MQANPTSENCFQKKTTTLLYLDFSDYEQKPRKMNFDVFVFSFILWVGLGQTEGEPVIY